MPARRRPCLFDESSRRIRFRMTHTIFLTPPFPRATFTLSGYTGLVRGDEMADVSPDYGDWQIAPDGKAHCLVAGRCLCGTHVDLHAPQLKATVGTTIDTPLCVG